MNPHKERTIILVKNEVWGFHSHSLVISFNILRGVVAFQSNRGRPPQKKSTSLIEDIETRLHFVIILCFQFLTNTDQ